MRTTRMIPALLSLALLACGGGTQNAADSRAATGPVAPAAVAAGGGPNLDLAKERLLVNANMTTPDSARLVSFVQTGIQFEGPAEMQSAIVSYEAELEFTADTYFHSEHKAGDHHKVFGEAEYLNEGGSWRLMTMGIYAR